VTNVNGRSLNTLKSGAILLKLPIGFRGRRLLTRRFARRSKKASMKPRMRVAHAKPTVGKSLCNISGKIMPPIEPEVMATPVAFPRLRRKKWPMEAIHGVLMRHPPTGRCKVSNRSGELKDSSGVHSRRL
jgi:hypothetical protein